MGKSPPEFTKSKVHGPNETQEKLRRKGYFIKSSIAGLGYTSKPPLRVMIKRVANYHIAEADQGPCIHPKTTTRRTVFQRSGPTPTTEKRNQQRSVFQRFGETTKDPIQRVSVFQRLGEVRNRGYDEPPYHQKKVCR
ncbi:hypothetical protein LIER_26843 [Lithospermum erythrorhizon]|uniref:Uncharacterized protein n=1 Tax=Lithospermum erythrorhizon TaxID=34254 RepID=A0AAV3RFP0_LITER